MVAAVPALDEVTYHPVGVQHSQLTVDPSIEALCRVAVVRTGHEALNPGRWQHIPHAGARLREGTATSRGAFGLGQWAK